MNKIGKILKRRFLTKSVLALVLALLLTLQPYGLAGLYVVYAEEGVGETETQTEESNGAEMDTGDAGAQADGSTEVNTNEVDTTGGEVSTDPCDVPDSCVGDTTVENDNTAEVDATTGADANTGINDQNDTDGDASMDTGDAGAGANTENAVNTNIVLIEGASEATDSGELVATDSASIDDGVLSETTVSNTNVADVDSQTSAGANTGGNNQNGTGGEADMDTGDAYASANSLNLVNTNVVGSGVQFVVLDIYVEDMDVNLYEAWSEFNFDSAEVGSDGTIEVANGVLLRIVTIENENLALVDTETTANANTGGNNQNGTGGSAEMLTGNAYAAANSVAFVNTNLVGSGFFVAVINIFGNLVGDIILPNPGQLNSSEQANGGANEIHVTNTNVAGVVNTSEASANSGGNNQNGTGDSASMGTGNATAMSHSASFVNSNVFASLFYHVWINNFGGWLGQVFGWESPTQVDSASEGASELIGEGTGGSSDHNQADLGITLIENNNTALVSTSAIAGANTGNNNQNGTGGNASMITGNAWSMANSLAFVNTNIIGSNFFFGLINILGFWDGDLILAHPDLVIDLSSPQEEVHPGESVSYTVTVTNRGHGPSSGVQVHNDDPDGMAYQSSSQGPSNVNGGDRSWDVGALKPGESATFTVDFVVDDGIESETKEVTYTVSVTGIEEEDMSNNSDSETDKVVFASQDEEEVEESNPLLYVSLWNNVNEYVFPGDTVTFELTVENRGDGSSYDTIVPALLFNEVPGPIGGTEFELGTIRAHERLVVSFKMPMPEDISVGHHRLVTQVSGLNRAGEEFVSNEAVTEFYIKGASLISDIVPEAQAAEGDVLGSLDEVACEQKKDWLPYILAAAIAALWGIDRARRKYPWLTLPLKKKNKGGS